MPRDERLVLTIDEFGMTDWAESYPGADLDRSIEITYAEISQLVAKAFPPNADDGDPSNFTRKRRAGRIEEGAGR